MSSQQLSPATAPADGAKPQTSRDASQPECSAAPQLDEERLAWLAMALAPGLGPKRILDAVKEIGRASQIFTMPLTALEGLKFPAGAAQFLFDGKGRRAAEEEWARVAAQGATLVSYSCPEYPERLREIYDPPPVLWVRGDVGLLSRPAIAVVGTRHPTPYGSGVAEMISRDLAARRLLIVSGMARGIDSCAHKGALAARMPTLAVWGTGIDVVYPKENRKLAEEILATGGAIVSEVPMGTFPAPQNFPRRNRILSGLSVAVLVVEASENSGTRVTARCAAEQNRDLFAVPGNVTNKGSWTPNTLIKQGAKLVATWEDVWEDLPSHVRIELEAEAPVCIQSARLAHPYCLIRFCGPRRRWCLRCCARTRVCRSTKFSIFWRRSLLRPRFLPHFLSWRWRGECGVCRGRITCERCRGKGPSE